PINPSVGAGCELECAVVEIVRVTAVELLTVTAADGEKLQLAAVGTPFVQAKVTVPLKPLMEVALRLKVAGCPELTVTDEPLVPTATAKSEPVPLRFTVCGPPVALSGIINVLFCCPGF